MLSHSQRPGLGYLSPEHQDFELVRLAEVFRERILTGDDGLLLHAYEAGDPLSPTLLLTLPFGISCALLGPLARQLATRFHVVTWETRGLPNFVAQEPDLSPAAHLQDLQVVLRAFGDLNPDYLVSYCSGANVALQAVACGAIQPDRLCLVSPPVEVAPGQSGPQTEYQKTMLPLLERTARDGLKFAALVRAMLGANGQAAQDGISVLNNLPFTSAESTLRYARLHAPWRSLPWRSMLAHVRCPVLIVHGEKDDYIHCHTVHDLSGSIDKSELRLVPDAGHFGVCENAVFHRLVQEFFSDTSTRESTGTDTGPRS